MLALVLLACRPAAPPDTGTAQTAPDLGKDERFDELVAWTEQSMAEWAVPGLALGVRVGGTSLHAPLGYRRLTTLEPVTLQTRFRIASLSKMLTGMAMAGEVVAGRIDPNAPASDWLGDLEMAEGSDLSDVTLLHLASHQSGLQAYGLPSACDPSPEVLESELQARAPDWNFWAGPGEHSIYSNAGFALIGLAVQRSSGEMFPDYMAAHVLGPAGLERASYDPEEVAQGDYATGHSFDMAGDGRLVAERDLLQRACGAANPASGLMADLPTLLQMGQLLLDEGAPVLDAEGWEWMTRTGYGDPDSSIYGWGIQVGSYRDHRVLTHTGSLHGFQSILYVVPEAELVVAVMVNSDHGVTLVPEPWSRPTHRVAERALDLFLGLEPQERTSSVRDPSDWSRYLGTFQSAFEWGERRVDQDDQGLFIEAGDGSDRQRLVPYSRDVFQFSYLSSEGLTYWTSIQFKQEDEQTRWLLSTDGLAERSAALR